MKGKLIGKARAHFGKSPSRYGPGGKGRGKSKSKSGEGGSSSAAAALSVYDTDEDGHINASTPARHRARVACLVGAS